MIRNESMSFPKIHYITLPKRVYWCVALLVYFLKKICIKNKIKKYIKEFRRFGKEKL